MVIHPPAETPSNDDGFALSMGDAWEREKIFKRVRAVSVSESSGSQKHFSSV